MKTLRFYAHLLQMNIRSAFASGFWLQMLFMIMNNVIFWIIWRVFFGTFDHVNGWRLPEVTLMYATSQLAWGLKIIGFAGTRNLAKTIADGEIDGYLLQPRHPLLHIAASRSFGSGWGDLVSGIALAGISGLLTAATTPLYVLAVIAASLTFLAAEVCLHSIAFWLGPTNTLSRMMTEYIIMLSCYPQNVYSGWVKLATYILLPAAVIGFLPVELVRGNWQAGGLIVVLTAMFVGAAWLTWTRGLMHRMRA